jgi:DNA-directed RNA polymerase subunit beta'
LHPQLLIKNSKSGDILGHYPLPADAVILVKDKAKVKPGQIIAQTSRQVAKNKDITGGLPRISELFEARTPKEVSEIAKIDGIVEVGKVVKSKRSVIVRDPETGAVEEHMIPTSNKHLTIRTGDKVKKGDKLTEGSVVPHDLLEVCGIFELQNYLKNEIQLVYKGQGVEINDKHIEIVINQMLQKVRVTDGGDTTLLAGEEIDKYEFQDINDQALKEGGAPAEATPILLGITKAALATKSFISAASFQDTTRIITDAATLGKADLLKGFKENVITGHLIPAGTGTKYFQELEMEYLGTPYEEPEEEIIADDIELETEFLRTE